MHVKKTPAGKYAFALEFEERQRLFMSMINFLEGESVAVRFVKLKTDADVNRHLHYAVLDELLRKHMGKLCSANKIEKLTLQRSEALALTWLLRGNEDMKMLDLKGSLHQKLQ